MENFLMRSVPAILHLHFTRTPAPAAGDPPFLHVESPAAPAFGAELVRERWIVRSGIRFTSASQFPHVVVAHWSAPWPFPTRLWTSTQ